jgi:UDP-2,4-diacetamido-2,4,6-trideoxy-beta-L-altropyranose hydrolase
VGWQQDANETCAALRDAPPDWLVVDHYAFDARWHDAVRNDLQCRVLVVDDTADRPLSPDALLDHNWAPDHREKYRGRLTREPVWLTGPRFALLSPAYRTAPRYRFNAEVRSLGIFMGGTDPGGISTKVLHCVRAEARFTGPVEVVSTSSNPHLRDLRAACAAWPGTVLTLDEPDLAGFFARHDLHIGAGGGATWERRCIGVPTIALVVADNQAPGISALHHQGALLAARLPDVPMTQVAQEARPLPDVVRLLLEDAKARQRIGEAATALVDGRGAQRLALQLTRGALQLRQATTHDATLLHEWRNHPAVREVSLNAAPIAFADHLAWMQRVLLASDRWLLIARVGKLAVGSIRFDRLEDGRLEVSLYLDPALQGLGLGRELLLQGEQYMSRMLGNEVVIHAVVRPGNHASSRLFESRGYVGGPTSYAKTVPIHRQALESTT